MRRELYDALRASLEAEELVAVATVVAGPGFGAQQLLWSDGRTLGSLGSDELDAVVAERAVQRMRLFGADRFAHPSAGGEVEVFVEVHPPPPQLVVVGAVHTAIPLLTMARPLGYRTVVVDPRGAFATAERFAHADRLLRAWPQEAFAELTLSESTAVAVLSHDLKLDLPALELALASPAFYVGALGSRKTHAKRRAALAEAGFSEEQIERIRAPIGLDLGGRRPEEIAVAILAEIVAAAHGRRLAPVVPEG